MSINRIHEKPPRNFKATLYPPSPQIKTFPIWSWEWLVHANGKGAGSHCGKTAESEVGIN